MEKEHHPEKSFSHQRDLGLFMRATVLQLEQIGMEAQSRMIVRCWHLLKKMGGEVILDMPLPDDTRYIGHVGLVKEREAHFIIQEVRPHQIQTLSRGRGVYHLEEILAEDDTQREIWEFVAVNGEIHDRMYNRAFGQGEKRWPHTAQRRDAYISVFPNGLYEVMFLPPQERGFSWLDMRLGMVYTFPDYPRVLKELSREGKGRYEPISFRLMKSPRVAEM